jgi:hypothetical protein
MTSLEKRKAPKGKASNQSIRSTAHLSVKASFYAFNQQHDGPSLGSDNSVLCFGRPDDNEPEDEGS